MILKVLNSRSVGNCYLLESESQVLIIEAGVPFKRVKQALDFNLSKIVGCIISHEHQDHSKYINEYLMAGIEVKLSSGTNRNIKYTSCKFPLLTEHKNIFKMGDFKIMAFNIIHDAEEPLGFLINHPESGNILFLTDTGYSPWKFSDLSHILVECNFSQEILDENIISGRLSPLMRNRLMDNHISIETCKELLKSNDLSKVRNIILLHLSDGNSNAKQFKEEIQGLTGIQTLIAEKGLEVNFNINSF